MSKYLLSLSASLLAVTPALAQDAAPAAEAAPAADDSALITVIATGSQTRVDQSGQPITVITADEIASIQGPDLTRVLERVPGITITRNGGLGSFTGVRLRGADAEQVLVLIDGVRVEDVSAPSGGFDFGTLLPGGIERVDVLRGSNSVVWGSAALGGVIAVQGRELQGAEASVEYGTNDTLTADASAGLSVDRYALSLNGGYSRSDGVSSAASGTEADGFRQWHVGGKTRIGLSDTLSFVAAGRYADTRTEIDGFPAPAYTFADTPEFQKTRQASGRAGLRYENGALTLNSGFAVSDTKRDYFDPTYGTDPSYGYKARSERADITGRLALPYNLALDFGGDSEWTRYSGTYDAQQKARQTSGHALLGWTTERASLAAGLRIDDHSRFGTEWTFGANGTVTLIDNLRLRASYGEGFKTPTLFQLLSNYGNAALAPERSRSYDAGIEYGSRGGALHAAVTVFRRDSRDLIAYVSCYDSDFNLITTGICANRPYGTYDNTAKARAEGVEVELGARPSDTLRVQAAYTYVRSRNLTAGSANFENDLARRPRNALTLSADWTSPLAGLTLGADLRLVGDSYDNASNTTRLDGYAVTTLRASLPVTARFELFGRIENLFDVDQTTTAGYGSWGRAGFVGVRAKY